MQRRTEATDGQIDGGPAVRSDGGGDRDCGSCEQVNILNAVDFLTDEIYLFQAGVGKFR
jgi:hypothetical protein